MQSFHAKPCIACPCMLQAAPLQRTILLHCSPRMLQAAPLQRTCTRSLVPCRTDLHAYTYRYIPCSTKLLGLLCFSPCREAHKQLLQRTNTAASASFPPPRGSTCICIYIFSFKKLLFSFASSLPQAAKMSTASRCCPPLQILLHFLFACSCACSRAQPSIRT